MVQGTTALDELLGGQGPATALDALLGDASKPHSRKVKGPPSTASHVAAKALGGLSGSIEGSAEMLGRLREKAIEKTGIPRFLLGGPAGLAYDALPKLSREEAAKGLQSSAGVSEDPARSGFWESQVPEAIGGTAGFGLQTAALGPLGVAAGMGAKAGALAAGASTGALGGAGQSFDRTLQETGDEAQAWRAALGGALVGTTEAADVLVAFGAGKTLGKLVKGPLLARIDKKLGGILKEAVFGGAVEGLQEGSQGVLSEFVALRLDKEELSYLQDLKTSAAQFPEGAKIGMTIGVLLGGGGAVVRGKAKPAKVGIKGEAEARSAEPGGATPAAPEPDINLETPPGVMPSVELGQTPEAPMNVQPEVKSSETPNSSKYPPHMQALLAKAKAYDDARGTTITDVTPEGYGPVEASPESVSIYPSDTHLTTEQQALRKSRDEARTLLRGEMPKAKRAAIERSLVSTERKLAETGYREEPPQFSDIEIKPKARGPVPADLSSSAEPASVRPLRKPQAEAKAVPPPEPSVAPSGEPARAQEGESPIGIKRSAIEAEHAEHGYGPVESEAAKSFGETWENAKAKADADPTVTERVIKGDAVQGLSSDERGAVILREKVRLSNERDTLKEQLTTAYQRADTDGIKALEDRAKKLSDERLAVEAARVRESADRGRGLAAFKMLANKDFSLAGIETSLRIANGGAPLTPEQNVIAERISKKLSDLEKQVDVLIAEQSAKAETQAKRAAPKASPERTARLLQFTGAAAEAARARSKSRGVRAMAGLDPADLADRIIIGVDYLARDVAKFADWSSAMVKEFGETIKPHLQDIFDKARLALADSENVAQRQKSSETRSKKAIDEMRRRIETGDFGPRPERQELPKTPAMIRLEAEKQMVRQELQKHVADAEAARRTPLQKFGGGVKELTEASRALTFSADASATLAQGLFATLDPKNATKVPRWLGNMRRAAFSEKAAREQDIALRDSAEGKKALAAGVELSSPGDGLGPHEEMFRTRWLKAVPGIGGVVKGSDRAFSSYLNQIRVEMYNNWENAMPYEPSRAEKKKLASNAGIMTGRGDPGRYTQLSNAAGYFVTAPRLYLSQWQILAGSPFYGKGTTPATRKVMAQQAVRSAIGVATVFALGKALGGDVDLDPRQPGGPSISFGDTKVHPLGGLGSAARMGLGAATTATGALAEVVDEDVGKSIRGEAVEGVDGKAKAMRFEDAVRYGRGKLLPAWATLTNILDRKDVTGRPASVASELGPRGEPPYLPRVITPLAWNDISKIFREHGIGAGAALNLLNFLGMRVTHYEDRKKVK